MGWRSDGAFLACTAQLGNEQLPCLITFWKNFGLNMLLWTAAPPPDAGRRLRRTVFFTSAALVSCVAVPGIFLIGPLATNTERCALSRRGLRGSAPARDKETA